MNPRILKNALSNIIRGIGSGVVALVLPHFLVKALTPEKFGAWSLMLQVSAYAGYFEFGLQTAIARLVAQSSDDKDSESRSQLISTSLGLLVCLAAAAFLCLLVVIAQVRGFASIPLPLVHEVQMGCAVLTLTVAAALPFSVATAALVGLQRNEFPAAVLSLFRLTGCLLVVIVARYSNSLVLLAACVGIPNVLAGVVQWVVMRRLLPGLSVSLANVRRDLGIQLAKYCGSISIFSVCMMLITGLDVIIVAHFSFGAVGYYSIAATVITFFTGFNSAAFTALLAPLAVSQAKKEYDNIRNLLLRGTRLANLIDVFVLALCAMAGSWLLNRWIGHEYAVKVLPILEVLLVAQAVRFAGIAYATALNATGEQSKALYGAVVEAVTNFGFSVLFAYKYGAMGVALGTLAGSLCGHVFTVLFTMRWTYREIPIDPVSFEMSGVLRPAACAIPCLIAGGLVAVGRPVPGGVIGQVAAVLLSVALALRFADTESLLRFRRKAVI